MGLRAIFQLLKDTYSEWNEDKAPRLAAALSYYALFSAGPLLLVVISIAGLVFGDEAARGQIVEQIDGLVGTQAAQAIQAMLGAAARPSEGIVATGIGVVTLLLGAAGLFGQLQDALNTIWEMQPRAGGGLRGMIKGRLLSFAMVLVLGVLLLASLLLSAGLATAVNLFGQTLGIAEVGLLLQAANHAITFTVLVLVFGVVFKILPDVKIAWSDVWPGAAFTALLFTLGEIAIGLYIGYAGVGSAHGAAGSLVVLLVWIYYSAQIFLFGAEFTQVYANRYGSRIVSSGSAVPLGDEAPAREGSARREEEQEACAAPPEAKGAPSSAPSRLMLAGTALVLLVAAVSAVRGSRG